MYLLAKIYQDANLVGQQKFYENIFHIGSTDKPPYFEIFKGMVHIYGSKPEKVQYYSSDERSKSREHHLDEAISLGKYKVIIEYYQPTTEDIHKRLNPSNSPGLARNIRISKNGTQILDTSVTRTGSVKLGNKNDVDIVIGDPLFDFGGITIVFSSDPTNISFLTQIPNTFLNREMYMPPSIDSNYIVYEIRNEDTLNVGDYEIKVSNPNQGPSKTINRGLLRQPTSNETQSFLDAKDSSKKPYNLKIIKANEVVYDLEVRNETITLGSARHHDIRLSDSPFSESNKKYIILIRGNDSVNISLEGIDDFLMDGKNAKMPIRITDDITAAIGEYTFHLSNIGTRQQTKVLPVQTTNSELKISLNKLNSNAKPYKLRVQKSGNLIFDVQIKTSKIHVGAGSDDEIQLFGKPFLGNTEKRIVLTRENDFIRLSTIRIDNLFIGRQKALSFDYEIRISGVFAIDDYLIEITNINPPESHNPKTKISPIELYKVLLLKDEKLVSEHSIYKDNIIIGDSADADVPFGQNAIGVDKIFLYCDSNMLSVLNAPPGTLLNSNAFDSAKPIRLKNKDSLTFLNFEFVVMGAIIPEVPVASMVQHPMIVAPQQTNPVQSQNNIGNQNEQAVRCPKCGSTQITANKKGFSVGKALIGAAIVPFGLIGAVGTGFIGSGKVKVTCLACGHDWIAGKK